MAKAVDIGPCRHGVVENICWRCTRDHIGLGPTVYEWVALHLRRLWRAVSW